MRLKWEALSVSLFADTDWFRAVGDTGPEDTQALRTKQLDKAIDRI